MNLQPARGIDAINHIVVLMMENRSFDHMLGYLGLPGGIEDLDGLQNAQPNYDLQGVPHPPKRLGRSRSAFHLPGRPYDRSLDPCHAPDCVEEQLEEFQGIRPGGFIKNFIAKNSPPSQWRDLPMGYYDQECLPVYDFLARHYRVCDAWHSSIPGDTWPNRLHALAGRTGPKVHFDLLERLIALVTGKKPFIPIYEVEAFTRHLTDRQWRWYSHDPATLRAADKLYRKFTQRRQNFTYFDRKKLTDPQELAENLIGAHDSFLDDAAKGQLRQVSWIDPNFIDLHILHSISNDDHPPADILAGQELVLEVYHALVNTSDWNNTLLVICYDEHGGMYDHVSPPPVNDGSGYPTYGVRVPALLIGPRVKQGVHSQLLDHTTLIKTILSRFASNPARALASMPKRVQESPDLGDALQDEPRETPSHEHLFTELDEWRNEARAQRRASAPQVPSEAADGAGQPLISNDFQAEFATLAGLLRKKGLPPGQP